MNHHYIIEDRKRGCGCLLIGQIRTIKNEMLNKYYLTTVQCTELLLKGHRSSKRAKIQIKKDNSQGQEYED